MTQNCVLHLKYKTSCYYLIPGIGNLNCHNFPFEHEQDYFRSHTYHAGYMTCLFSGMCKLPKSAIFFYFDVHIWLVNILAFFFRKWPIFPGCHFRHPFSKLINWVCYSIFSLWSILFNIIKPAIYFVCLCISYDFGHCFILNGIFGTVFYIISLFLGLYWLRWIFL